MQRTLFSVWLRRPQVQLNAAALNFWTQRARITLAQSLLIAVTRCRRHRRRCFVLVLAAAAIAAAAAVFGRVVAASN